MAKKLYQVVDTRNEKSEGISFKDDVANIEVVRHENGTVDVRIDLTSTARRGKTAIRRFFKAVKKAADDGIFPDYASDALNSLNGWEDYMYESYDFHKGAFCEEFRSAHETDEDGRGKLLIDSPDFYKVELEEIGDSDGWYIYIIQRAPITKSTGDTEEREEIGGNATTTVEQARELLEGAQTHEDRLHVLENCTSDVLRGLCKQNFLYFNDRDHKARLVSVVSSDLDRRAQMLALKLTDKMKKAILDKAKETVTLGDKVVLHENGLPLEDKVLILSTLDKALQDTGLISEDLLSDKGVTRFTIDVPEIGGYVDLWFVLNLDGTLLCFQSGGISLHWPAKEAVPAVKAQDMTEIKDAWEELNRAWETRSRESKANFRARAQARRLKCQADELRDSRLLTPANSAKAPVLAAKLAEVLSNLKGARVERFRTYKRLKACDELTDRLTRRHDELVARVYGKTYAGTTSGGILWNYDRVNGMRYNCFPNDLTPRDIQEAWESLERQKAEDTDEQFLLPAVGA